MTARRWRKPGPWATPVLVVVEVAMVWSGWLSLGAAVLVGLGVEALLWVTAVSRTVVGVRRFRAGRASGRDGWSAMEDALAAMVPRRAARLLLIEPRLWISLARWVTGRHDGRRREGAFSYDGALRPVLWVAVALVVVEGGAVEVILAFATRSTLWVIVSLCVHGYAVLVLLGMLASFITRPHLLEKDVLRVRDGVFTEIVLPMVAITGVRQIVRPNFGRSGLKIDPDGHGALLAHGDATIELTLDPTAPVDIRPTPRPCLEAITALTVTADDPPELIRQLNEQLQRSPAGRHR